MWDSPSNGTFIFKTRNQLDIITQLTNLSEQDLCEIMKCFMSWEITGDIGPVHLVVANFIQLDQSPIKSFDKLMEIYSALESIFAKKWMNYINESK